MRSGVWADGLSMMRSDKKARRNNRTRQLTSNKLDGWMKLAEMIISYDSDVSSLVPSTDMEIR